MKRLYPAPLAALLFLAACAEPLGDLSPSFLTATVSGAMHREYRGTGEFHTGTPGPGRQQFQVTSRESGSDHLSFALTRWDGGRLEEGSYPLSLVDLSAHRRGTSAEGQPRGITVQFFTREGNRDEQFVAESGELEITDSSRERVEGRFRFSGFRYCAREVIRSNPPVPPEGPCTLPSAPLAGAPRITVSGSFVATPLKVEIGFRD